MKRLGLLGGMSWESTALYYRLLNQRIHQRQGGLSSANLQIRSFDFEQIRRLQVQGDWKQAGHLLAEAAMQLQACDCEAVAMCVNTMHRVAEAVKTEIAIPFIDIRGSASRQLAKLGAKKPLVLGGLQVTDAAGFYVTYLKQLGMDVLVPDQSSRQVLEQMIFDEFPKGIFSQASRQACLSIISQHMSQHGVDTAVLACTELPVLLEPAIKKAADGSAYLELEQGKCLVLDTVLSHVEEMVDFMLGDSHE
jgi:aspartate racemase